MDEDDLLLHGSIFITWQLENIQFWRCSTGVMTVMRRAMCYHVLLELLLHPFLCQIYEHCLVPVPARGTPGYH